jgi:hypothetical protein
LNLYAYVFFPQSTPIRVFLGNKKAAGTKLVRCGLQMQDNPLPGGRRTTPHEEAKGSSPKGHGVENVYKKHASVSFPTFLCTTFVEVEAVQIYLLKQSVSGSNSNNLKL